MICLIANGRSGTNALYYNLFNMPKEYNTKEPWKNIKLRGQKQFTEKKNMCKKVKMFHIKPGQHTELAPKELVDLLIKNNIKNFIVLKRMNIIAILVSDAILLRKKLTQDNKCTITKYDFERALKIFYWYENDCIKYLKTKKEVKYLKLIFEEDIKNDITIALNKVKNTFTTIPKSDYINKPPKQSELPFHAKHTALKDKRSLSEKIENIDEVRDFLGEKYKWMLE